MFLVLKVDPQSCPLGPSKIAHQLHQLHNTFIQISIHYIVHDSIFLFRKQSKAKPYFSDCMFLYAFLFTCVWQALGGLSYQALYQRILSAASTTQAQITCYAATLPLFIMAIPSVTIAAAASSAGMNLSADVLTCGSQEPWPMVGGKRKQTSRVSCWTEITT